MSSALDTIRKLTPRPLKWGARRVLRVAAPLWIRSREAVLGVPESVEAYGPLTRRLAAEFDCRLPVLARLGNGLPIEVVWRDYVSGHILRSGYYEPDTVALFRRFLTHGMTVVDIGAHMGQYTLVSSQLVGSSGEVHSFEPDPDTFRRLVRNCRRNSLQNVRLNQVALSDSAGRKTFYFATTQDVGSNSLAEPKNFSGRKADVQSMQLDAYLRERGVGAVRLVKMDVEGAELDVLRGGESLFSGPEAPMIIMEFEEERQRAFGASCATLGQWLTDRGYELYRIGATLEPYRPGPADPPSLNVLAVPRAKRSEIDGSRVELAPIELRASSVPSRATT